MKKIISVLTISALALGSVFADVSVEYTQKGYLSSNEGGVSKKLDLNGYNSAIKGDLVFSVSNDNAGVSVDIDPTYGDASGTAVKTIHKYFGWANFLDGKAQIKSGIWEGRTVNRMNSKAYKWEGTEYEMFKPGIIGGTIGTDISRTDANASGAKAFTTVATYKGEGFTVTGGLVTADFYADKADKKTDVKSGIVLDGAFNVNETTKISAIVKSTKDQEFAVGAFIDKKEVEIKDFSVNIMAGATFGSTPDAAKNTTTKGSTGNTLDVGFDFRAQTKLSDTVTLTTMNNVSYLGTQTASNGENGVVNVWDMVSLAAQVTEGMEVAVTGEWYYADTTKSANGYFAVVPNVRFTFPGADITSGLILRTFGWSEPSETSISVPFILHVKL